MRNAILQKLDLLKLFIKETKGLPAKEVAAESNTAVIGTVIGCSHLPLRRIPVSPLELPEDMVDQLYEKDSVIVLAYPRENVEFYKVKTSRGNVGYIPRFFLKIESKVRCGIDAGT